MKTKIVRDRGRVRLILDEEHSDILYEIGVVAGAIEMEGTDCWKIADMRLRQHIICSPFSGSIDADSVSNQMTPKNAKERENIIKHLHEYKDMPDGSIMWSSYDGIMKGSSSIDGYTPVSWNNFQPQVYFSREDVDRIMLEIQAFWTDYQGSLAGSKIDNPHYQLTEHRITSRNMIDEMLRAKRQDDDSPSP